MWSDVESTSGAGPLSRYRSPLLADVDEFRARASGLLSTHSIVVPGSATAPFHGEVRDARVGDIQVVYLEQGVDIDVDILDRLDYYDLMIAVDGSNRLEVVGSGERTLVRRATAALLSPNMRARMRMDSDYRQLHVRVERRAVNDALAAIVGRPVADPVTFDVELGLDAPALSSWSSALRLLLTDLDAETGLTTNPVVARHWQDLLISGLLVSHPHSHSAAVHGDRPEPLHPKRFRRALDFIDEHLAEPVAVSDVAAHIGVSVRSLQRAFGEQLDVAPSTYIRNRRLDTVRAALLDPDGVGTVTEVAAAAGFTHPSRFAAMYRRRFGESPSQTQAGR